MTASARARPLRIFWTGGWDSTFRLLHALFVDRRTVEPHYLVDPGRESTLHEVRAMHRIREKLGQRLDNPARLLPTRMMMRTEVPPIGGLRRLHARIAEQARIGSQYLWLAEYCHLCGLTDMELCLERADPPIPFHRLVFADARATPPRLSSRPEARLFERFSFPILHLAKGDMRQIAERHELLDMLADAWFCQRPVFSRPCGSCWPCRLATAAGQRYDAVPFRRVFLALHLVRKRWRAWR